MVEGVVDRGMDVKKTLRGSRRLEPLPFRSRRRTIMAAATVMRLQTIVSRELAAAEAAVVTIGSLQAGTKENVIPDEAVIELNVRSFDEAVRRRVLEPIERIVKAEAAPLRPDCPVVPKRDRRSPRITDRGFRFTAGHAKRNEFELDEKIQLIR